jgi:protein-tyrosine phosphatase
MPSNAQIAQEFTQIDRYQRRIIARGERSVDVGQTNAHHGLNRYRNILPYDHNRVLLQNHTHDYINSSHVSIGSQRFIATQGPLRNTAEDFWLMVSQIDQKEVVVLMLTELVEERNNTVMEKCYKYWSSNLKLKNGLHLQRLDKSSNYHDIPGLNYSKFILGDKKTETSTIVHHLYYTEWADFSKPADLQTLVQLDAVVNKQNKYREDVPIVTHCSAGVGRTGTFITFDYLLKNLGKIKEAGDDPSTVIPEAVRILRTQRPYLVQAPDQYLFLYHSLHQLLRLTPEQLKTVLEQE